MQCNTPTIKRWNRPNLVHNAIEKTSEGMGKKEKKKGFTIWKMVVILDVGTSLLAPKFYNIENGD
jgi:hypothetical protein